MESFFNNFFLILALIISSLAISLFLLSFRIFQKKKYNDKDDKPL